MLATGTKFYSHSGQEISGLAGDASGKPACGSVVAPTPRVIIPVNVHVGSGHKTSSSNGCQGGVPGDWGRDDPSGAKNSSSQGSHSGVPGDGRDMGCSCRKTSPSHGTDAGIKGDGARVTLTGGWSASIGVGFGL